MELRRSIFLFNFVWATGGFCLPPERPNFCAYFGEALSHKKLINTAHLLDESGLIVDSSIGKAAVIATDAIGRPVFKFGNLEHNWREAVAMSTENNLNPSVNFLKVLDIEPQVVGHTETFPQDRPIIVIANHPTGPVDGSLVFAVAENLGASTGRTRTIMTTFGQAFRGIDPDTIFVKPVEETPKETTVVKSGAVSRAVNVLKGSVLKPNDPSEIVKVNGGAMKTTLGHLKKNGTLVIFPAGRIGKLDSQGRVKDFPWMNSFVRMARKSKALVVPMALKDLRNPDEWYTSKFRSVSYDTSTSSHIGKRPIIDVHAPIDLNAGEFKDLSDEAVSQRLYELIN